MNEDYTPVYVNKLAVSDVPVPLNSFILRLSEITQTLKGATVLIALMCWSIIGLSQSAPLEEEDNQFSLSSGYSNAGIPVYLSYELMVYKNISFSVEGSIRFYNESTDSASYGHTLAGLTFYGNYYFNSLIGMSEDMGLYAGLHFGYFKWFSPDGYAHKGNGSSTLVGGGQIGYRYYFSNFGAFIEALGDSHYVGGRLGVSYKFQ